MCLRSLPHCCLLLLWVRLWMLLYRARPWPGSASFRSTAWGKKKLIKICSLSLCFQYSIRLQYYWNLLRCLPVGSLPCSMPVQILLGSARSLWTLEGRLRALALDNLGIVMVLHECTGGAMLLPQPEMPAGTEWMTGCLPGPARRRYKAC